MAKAALKTSKDGLLKDVPIRIDQAGYTLVSDGTKNLNYLVISDGVKSVKCDPTEVNLDKGSSTPEVAGNELEVKP